MTPLSKDHIAFIIRDLHSRGLVLEGFEEEMIDHFCSAVEEEMSLGYKFRDAYHRVLIRFGRTAGILETQKQVLKSHQKTPRYMVRNYFKIAFRNLARHRFYASINIGGLAIGVACSLIIMLYIGYELSYDKHFPDYDRIYRIDGEIKFGENYYHQAVVPAPLGPTLVQDFPEVESAARLRDQGSFMVRRDKDKFTESEIIYADSSFFDVFELDFIYGSPEKALAEPNTVVISKRTAEKYFPGEDPVDKNLIFFDDWNVTVNGVFDDMPPNSHFHFDILVSMEGNTEAKGQTWLSNNFHTYFKLREGADIEALEAKFPKMIETYVGPEASQVLGDDFTMEKFYGGGNKYAFAAMPVADIHLYSSLDVELEANSDIVYVYLLGVIALFIVAIACINFMNLSTARSSNRAREVGIRKVMGSLRSHLVRQFLVESILLAAFACVLAVVIAYALLPLFSPLSGVQLHLPIGEPWFWTIMVAGTLVIGVLAGIYPSFFLSSFKPVHVLKGKLSLGMKSGLVRSGLVVFQFLVTIFLVIGTMAIHQQLSFIQEKKLGFQKDQVVVVKQAYSLGSQLDAYKNQILQDNRIINGTVTDYLPVPSSRSNTSYWPFGKQATQENLVGIYNFFVDQNYIPTMGMEVLEGRNFSTELKHDSLNVILNEAAVRVLGFTDPIGQKIETFAGTEDNSIDQENKITYTVIGVIKDFHFQSMREHISPAMLIADPSNGSISFRFSSEDTNEVIAILEKAWKDMAPAEPFGYYFLDEAFGNMYQSEQRLGNIFGVFAVLAIIIASLGLFALTAYTTEQRTREIGIRKVLGASVSTIVLMLSREYGKLIGIAFVLAVPLAWFAVDWWLQQFTYKAEIGIVIFVLAGVFAFGLAWLTMGFQSFKAASANPANALRSE